MMPMYMLVSGEELYARSIVSCPNNVKLALEMQEDERRIDHKLHSFTSLFYFSCMVVLAEGC